MQVGGSFEVGIDHHLENKVSLVLYHVVEILQLHLLGALELVAGGVLLGPDVTDVISHGVVGTTELTLCLSGATLGSVVFDLEDNVFIYPFIIDVLVNSEHMLQFLVKFLFHFQNGV